MGLFKKQAPTRILKKGKAHIVTFLNQKGGVGKTTLLYQYAKAASLKEKKVLLIDMDPQANLTSLYLHSETDEALCNQAGLYHLLINSVSDLKALHTEFNTWDVLIEGEDGIDLLPSGQELSQFEVVISQMRSMRQHVLRNFLLLSGLTDQYDLILIDGPPTLGMLVMNVMASVDGIFLPFIPDQFSRKGLEHTMDVIDELEESGIFVQTPKVLGLVPNLMDKRRRSHKDTLRELHEDLDSSIKLFDPLYNNAWMAKLSHEKKSIFDSESLGVHDLKKYFFQLLEHEQRELS